MAKFQIDMLTVNRYYTTLEIEAATVDPAKRIALQRAEAALDDLDANEELWGSPSEIDLTAWQAGADITDGDDRNRMRIGDAAYEAAGETS